MNIATLLAAPRELRIESIVVTTTGITMMAATTKAQAACPTCKARSRHVHSRYLRTVADLPWQGVAVRFGVERGRRYERLFTHLYRDVTS